MDKDEALKIAFQALKTIDEAMPFPVAKLAQKVIKEALAQPDHIGFMDSKLNPIQHTWVGLTDAEIGEIYRVGWATNMELVRAVEAKLKSKNNADN